MPMQGGPLGPSAAKHCLQVASKQPEGFNAPHEYLADNRTSETVRAKRASDFIRQQIIQGG